LQTKINVGNGEWTLVSGYYGEMKPALMFFKNTELAVVGEQLFAPVAEPDLVLIFENNKAIPAFEANLETIKLLFNTESIEALENFRKGISHD